MQHNGWDHGLTVADDGTGLAGQCGGVLLRKLADQCGLTAALEAALARAATFPQLSRGLVVVSMAIAIALGATSMSDIAVLAQLAPVLGAAPSGSTVRRALGLADTRTLARIAQARARILISEERGDTLRIQLYTRINPQTGLPEEEMSPGTIPRLPNDPVRY
jgi:hypothetical protein